MEENQGRDRGTKVGLSSFRAKSRNPVALPIAPAGVLFWKLLLFFLGRFFSLHPSHFLRQTSGVLLVLNIIHSERRKHVVRVVPGPILVRICVSHL